MVIQHSIEAMNANGQLNVIQDTISKSQMKLSSGYKINLSADDAAGLAISEKMRKQIRGLTRASLNAEDGVSLMQVADGALAEIADMLDRGVELSVQAANGTLSTSDREAIQGEISQICEEIDDIREKTKFNEIYVLKWNEMLFTWQTGTVVRKVGALPGWVKSGVDNTKTANALKDGGLTETYYTTETYNINTTNPDGTNFRKADVAHSAASLDFSNLNAGNVADLVGMGFNTTCFTCDKYYSIQFTNSTSNELPSQTNTGNTYVYKIGIAGVTTAEELIKRIISGTQNGNPNSHYTMLAADATNPKILWIYDKRVQTSYENTLPNDPNDQTKKDPDFVSWDASNSTTLFNYGISHQDKGYNKRGLFSDGYMDEFNAFSAAETEVAKSISFHVGSDSDDTNKVVCMLPYVSSDTLGISHVNVVQEPNGATNAIDAFGNAKNIVSAFRSNIGAYQNRLEHSVKNLDNVVENTTSSESLIRDTDMATEMVRYSNANIVAQAGQSMLANANQTNQGVLILLG